MAKKTTMPTDPFDDVIPAQQPNGNKEPNQPKEDKQPQSVKKERFTVHIPSEIVEKIRNCVYFTPGLTVAELAELAFDKEISEREELRGEPFPRRQGKLKTGRPIKT